jgi:hypothetical protein
MARWGGQDVWIPSARNPKLEKRRERARKMRGQGIHVRLIAERLGCSVSTVYSDLDGMSAFDDPAIKRWHGLTVPDLEGGTFWNGDRMG